MDARSSEVKSCALRPADHGDGIAAECTIFLPPNILILRKFPVNLAKWRPSFACNHHESPWIWHHLDSGKRL